MPTKDKRAGPSPAVLARYNAVPTTVWSVLSLGPLSVFCYQHVARPWLYGFVAVSLLAWAMPARWLRRLQLSAGPALYRRLGVPVANRFTQHGAIVNKLLRRRYPQYRHLPIRAEMARLVRTTYQQERFHWGMLLFFLLVAVYAAGHGQPGWAGLLTLLNIVYNLYPVWLQQYLRVRLGQSGRAASGG